MTQSFKTRPVAKGKGIQIAIPFDPNMVWGLKERHYITGTVGGWDVRGSIGSDGLLSLGPAWLRCRPLPEGEVQVVLRPEGPQVGEMAADVRAAFAAAPEATAFFESLATFYRKGFIEPIEAAKRAETRAARIAEMIESLNAGKRQK